LAIVLLASGPALAQQATPGAQQAPPGQRLPPWNTLPRMQLERQFAGPLQDTIVQRWLDPVDGSVCYFYIPITAPHSAPTDIGYVQYGSNTIGSVSCIAGRPSAPPPPPKQAPRAPPKVETVPQAAPAPQAAPTPR